ncbi:MAG: succinate--CoA ligase subunit alpha [bacterium]
MNIILNKDTKILIQGITQPDIEQRIAQMKAQGAQVVAGIKSAGRGTKISGIPVFNSVKEAIVETGAQASLICSAAPDVYYDGLEAVVSGLKLIVCTTYGVPVHDMVKLLYMVRSYSTCWIGPHSPGIVRVGETSLSMLPKDIFNKGGVSIVSRSNTVLPEIIQKLSASGLGQNYIIGLGDSLVSGAGFEDFLPRLKKDFLTQAVLLVDEPYGKDQGMADYIKQMKKPVIGFVYPSTKHANEYSILYNNVSYLKDAGIPMAESIEDIPELINTALVKVRT